MLQTEDHGATEEAGGQNKHSQEEQRIGKGVRNRFPGRPEGASDKRFLTPFSRR
jgi:hypothetical protein